MSSDSKQEVPINKYEQVLVAARESRRLNDLAKLNGRELKRRPTSLGWERLAAERITYTYAREALEDQVMEIPQAEPVSAPAPTETQPEAE